jgi:lipopolysaccharide exporter
VATELLGLVSMVVLTRLVPPAEFGAVAVVMIVNELANGLAGNGYGAPLVQRASITRAHVQAVALLATVTSVVLVLATLGVAAVLPDGLFGARTVELLPLMAPMFLVSGLTIVSRALLERKLDFGRLSRNDMTTIVVSTTTSLTLALIGLDGEAIILGLLAGGVTSLIMYQRAAPMPLPRWRPAELREVLAFGLPNAASGMAYVGTRNIDYAIVSAAFGPTRTGFYYRAYLLGVEYQNKFSKILVQILFPLFSRAESVEGMRLLRAKVIRANAVVVFGALGTFIVIAPVLIPFVLGSTWEPAVLPAQILAIGGLAASVNVGAEGMTVAAGEPGRVMRFTFAQLAIYIVLLLFSTNWGLIGLCVAVACFRWGVLAASYSVLLGRLGVPLRQLVRDAGPATVALAALLSVGLAVTEVMRTLDAAAAPSAALAGLAGLAAYVWALWWVFPEVWGDVTRIGMRVLRPGRDAPPAPAPAQADTDEASGHEPPRRTARGERKPEQAPAVP